MNTIELLEIISGGESSKVQFKEIVSKKNDDDIVTEMVAYANSEGGLLIIGVKDKTGEITGLTFTEIEEINNLLFNLATNNVKPAIIMQTETIDVSGKKVIVANISKGFNKPYYDNKMVPWIKIGSNKRRMTPEEIERFLQEANKIYAEKKVIDDSSIDDLNKEMFYDFYKKKFKTEVDVSTNELLRLTENLRLSKNGKITIAGVLLFGMNTEILLPEFRINAIWFWGNEFITNDYRSSENIYGNLKNQYDRALSFVMGALKKVQKDKSFNSLGEPEIPVDAIIELLMNALIHRNYLIPDSIKLYIFENRIEIKSPGKLPNSLTVDDIKKGIQRRDRNIIISSYATDILPYRGTGSGILKAIQLYPKIEFENNIEAEYFKVTIFRETELKNKI
ncbi:MAG: putative DNA binding domain-containing protein [Spirochaetes bacterium]|nr:putative DNA binding domain-containing protein [Spirochaetota bacterium]